MANIAIQKLRAVIKDFGTCLDFRSGGILTLGTSNQFSGSFYFHAKIKWYGLNGSYNQIFNKRDSYGTSGMMFSLSLRDTDGVLVLDTNTGIPTIIITNYVPRKYVPIDFIWVHNMTTGKEEFYIDGVLIINENILTLGSKTDALISIGGTQNPGIESFNGSMDELVIGTGTLTQEQVIALKNTYQSPNQWTYLKLDEGSGTIAIDSSGNGNNGTIVTAVYATDKIMTTRTVVDRRVRIRDFGSCIKFLNANQYINFPSIAAYNFSPLSSYSFNIWINPFTPKDFNFAIYKGTGGVGGYAIFVNTNNNTLVFQELKGFTSETVQFAMSLRRFNNLIITYNGTTQTIKFYVNGDLKTTSPGHLNWGNVTADTTTSLKVGGNTGAAILGLLDEMVITNTEMSLAEVKDAYYAGIYPTKIFHAKMDENTGTTTADTQNANNGTFINSPTWSSEVFMKPRIAI